MQSVAIARRALTKSISEALNCAPPKCRQYFLCYVLLPMMAPGVRSLKFLQFDMQVFFSLLWISDF